MPALSRLLATPVRAAGRREAAAPPSFPTDAFNATFVHPLDDDAYPQYEIPFTLKDHYAHCFRHCTAVLPERLLVLERLALRLREPLELQRGGTAAIRRRAHPFRHVVEARAARRAARGAAPARVFVSDPPHQRGAAAARDIRQCNTTEHQRGAAQAEVHAALRLRLPPAAVFGCCCVASSRTLNSRASSP